MAYEFLLPDIGEGLTEAEIVRWVVSIGGTVDADGPLVEVETDKAVVEITSPYGGVVLYQGAAAGEVLNVGAVLTVIGQPGESWSPADAAPIVGTLVEEAEILPNRVVVDEQSAARGVKALPLIRKLAKDLGVDLVGVQGTGPGGRISREDVRALADRSAATQPSPRVEEEGEERLRLSRLRRTIADRMEQSWREIPHVTTFDTVQADHLLDLRGALSARFDTSIPIETLVVMAVLPVLAEFPEFNGTLDGEDLIIKRHYDIGVAADTPDGLILPVVKRADRMGPARPGNRDRQTGCGGPLPFPHSRRTDRGYLHGLQYRRRRWRARNADHSLRDHRHPVGGAGRTTGRRTRRRRDHRSHDARLAVLRPPGHRRRARTPIHRPVARKPRRARVRSSPQKRTVEVDRVLESL